ncbi:hypothetical protein [Streptomyces canus]|uniref:hypothetical protein n=1 Tax=Streptomyces canus TaxID=58343 RepID=UPI0036E7B31B
MLVALLAVLGVNLLVVAALLAALLGRRRWLSRRPGAFRGAARVVEGDIDGIRRRWTAGYGRWVRDVFVWTPAPLLLRTVLLPVDAVSAVRSVAPKEVRRPRHLTAVATLTAAPRILVEVAVGDREDLAARPPAPGTTGSQPPRNRL